MAGRKDNLKSLFSNTRTRIIIVFTAVAVVLAVIVGVIRFSSLGGNIDVSSANLSGAPGGIQSVPGALDPTQQYAALQQKQNVEQAKVAEKTGKSAIPTLVRSQAFGNGTQTVGPQHGEGSVGFSALNQEAYLGTKQKKWVDALKEYKCSKKSIDDVINEGATLTDLKKGCSCKQLKISGFSLEKLQQVCSCTALKDLGYSAKDFKDAGYSAEQLRNCGFNACQMRGSGFTAQELRNGGYTSGELRGAGFSEDAIGSKAGLPSGITTDDVAKAKCNVTDLRKLKEAGVAAETIRRVSGCSARTLGEAGFTAKNLRNAGFSAASLKNAGFNATQLKAAGYSPRSLLDAGFTPEKLSEAGFTPSEIKSGEARLPPGVTPGNVKDAGCSEGAISRERKAGISAVAIRQYGGCSLGKLKNAGFNDSDLENAGFTPAQIQANKGISEREIRAAGCSESALQQLYNKGVSAAKIKSLNGCSTSALKTAGFSAEQLLNAGFTPKQLETAGFTPSRIKTAQEAVNAQIKAAGCQAPALERLRKDGVSAAKVRSASDCSAKTLASAGFDAGQLLQAGFTPLQLGNAGFSAATIKSAANEVGAIKEAGCSPAALAKLRQTGVTAARIKEVSGCSVKSLKAAGFDLAQLAGAGFTPSALEAEGFTPEQVKSAESTIDAKVKAAGCNPAKLSSLEREGVDAKRIKDLNGCSASALNEAGFALGQLKAAGFTPQQLQAAGISPTEGVTPQALSNTQVMAAGCSPSQLAKLKAEGISARRIHNLSGCTVSQLKSAGFDAKDLANAGFSPQNLLDAGFTPAELNSAGLNPTATIADGRAKGCDEASLKSAEKMGVSPATIVKTLGCSAQALKDAGFTAEALRGAGFTAADLKNAGFSANQLKQAGYDAQDLKDAGFSASELKKAGFSASDLRDAGFNAKLLKNAGFSAKELKAAGYSAKDLKDGGYSPKELEQAGFTAQQLKTAGLSASALQKAGYSASALKDAGFSSNQIKKAGYSDKQLEDAGFNASDSSLAGLGESPSGGEEKSLGDLGQEGPGGGGDKVSQNTKHLQEIMKRQQKQVAEQRYQQKIQQRTNTMVSAANQMMQKWGQAPSQAYVSGSAKSENTNEKAGGVASSSLSQQVASSADMGAHGAKQRALVKTGDIMFAVLDTSVNSDEPSPILATIVSGKFKGAKLIGNFHLAPNSDKLVISFNTLSVPSAPGTTSVSAYAIDPETANTALATNVNHHYLQRYGSLFASTFLEGFGNAFQSANTTVTIGGTGGVQNTTLQSGIGRSILENAVIGLATLGKSWAQVAREQVNRPITVTICAGTGIGVLFTQDLTSI